jgi:hypothetical protein
MRDYIVLGIASGELWALAIFMSRLHGVTIHDMDVLQRTASYAKEAFTSTYAVLGICCGVTVAWFFWFIERRRTLLDPNT